jgi:membrane protein
MMSSTPISRRNHLLAAQPRAWWTTLTRVYDGVQEDRIVSTAGGVSFFMLLAIFPGLAGLISLYGLIADSQSVTQHIDLLSGILPEGGLQLLHTQLDKLTSEPAPRLGIASLVALVISLWSANGGIKALFDALNIAYDEKEKREFITLNLVSLALTLGAIGFMIASLLAITILPKALAWAGRIDAGAMLDWLRWPILLAVANLGIVILYRFGPSRSRPSRWRWITPGSAVATLAWIGISLLFSFYTGHFGSYDRTYGSLGAAVGFMTWLWISTIVILIGAKLDAELARMDGVIERSGSKHS